MDPKRPLILLLILLLVPTIQAQSPTSCQGNERYCRGDVLYRCVDSNPEVYQYCAYACEDGTCVTASVEPGTVYVPVEETTKVAGWDYFFWGVLIAVLITISVLYLRIRSRG